MRSIRHPHLLIFYGAGVNHEKRAFLVTELMEGAQYYPPVTCYVKTWVRNAEPVSGVGVRTRRLEVSPRRQKKRPRA